MKKLCYQNKTNGSEKYQYLLFSSLTRLKNRYDVWSPNVVLWDNFGDGNCIRRWGDTEEEEEMVTLDFLFNLFIFCFLWYLGLDIFEIF